MNNDNFPDDHSSIDLLNREETRAFLAAIVESSNDAIIGKTRDFRIISWNKGAEKLYGYSAGEVLGKHISIIIPEDRRNEPDFFIENFLKGYNLDHYETGRLRKDGSSVSISLTISPIENLDRVTKRRTGDLSI